MALAENIEEGITTSTKREQHHSEQEHGNRHGIL
jgi:hypothetical protein